MGFKHRFYQSLGGSFAALALSMAPALAEELQDWSFDTSSSELTFSLSDQVFPEFFLLAEPPRLVLDIPNTEIGNIDPEQLYGGAVQAIRVAQYTPDNVRVVIELAPDIILSPDQADIQFDNGGDGQRYWHFRPLIADSEDRITTTAAAPATLRSADPDVSLSAASLKLPVERPNSTALPIDPYDADHGSSSTTVVSVPPLDVSDAESDAESDTERVSVPPLAGLSDPGLSDPGLSDPGVSSNPSISAVAADVPELPPMVVPDLEDTGGNTEPTMPVAADNNLRQNLPELDARAIDAQPEQIAITEPLGLEPAQSDTENTETPDEAAVAIIAPVVEAATSEAATSEVAIPEVSRPKVPTETALAPVESLIRAEQTPATVAESNRPPAPVPIQQPAAERTIVQTEAPSPVTFGQPIPAEL